MIITKKTFQKTRQSTKHDLLHRCFSKLIWVSDNFLIRISQLAQLALFEEKYVSKLRTLKKIVLCVLFLGCFTADDIDLGLKSEGAQLISSDKNPSKLHHHMVARKNLRKKLGRGGTPLSLPVVISLVLCRGYSTSHMI